MSKAKVAIVVDSTAYLPPAIIQQYQMQVVPLLVNWDEQSLRDNVDITPDQFYQRLKTSKSMPTTSQPSPGDFKVTFEKVAQTAESIVCLTISEPLSGTYASAMAAKQMVDIPVEVVDSRSAAMGLGFMALAAARAAEQGQDHQAVAALARSIISKMNLLFVVDTLEFLHRGGRIGGASRYIGTMLSIKPILHLKDGKIEPLERVRTKSKAVNHILNIMAQEADMKKTHVAIIHAAAEAEAKQLYGRIQELEPHELFLTEISPVIGTHTGPGAIGLVYYSD